MKNLEEMKLWNTRMPEGDEGDEGEGGGTEIDPEP
jgi:hypothetical protein